VAPFWGYGLRELPEVEDGFVAVGEADDHAGGPADGQFAFWHGDVGVDERAYRLSRLSRRLVSQGWIQENLLDS
jgi:hypothetical protein